MPKAEYFPKALYTFDIGQNDLGAGFSSNMNVQEVNSSVSDIVNSFSTNVKVVSWSLLYKICSQIDTDVKPAYWQSLNLHMIMS